MKRVTALFLALSLLLLSSCGTKMPSEKGKTSSPAGETGESRLLLTVACLSDLHNQEKLITSDPPKLREDIGDVLAAMKEEENGVDVILIGGDVTSDSTTSQAQVHGILDQLMERTDPLTKNVLFVSGNHDYNAGYEAGYNSADYYDYLMKDRVGALSGDDAYYEFLLGADYLLGYHYVLGGVDFIGISPSPADLKADQNYYYQYTPGTVNWLSQTLERIGKEKTVLLFGHFPFADSHSLSDGKGMLPTCDAQMKAVCKDYPNLLYLYGHDHGGDKAYTLSDTAQRVTRYDADGLVAGGGDEVSFLGERTLFTYAEAENGGTLRLLSGGKYLALSDGLTLSDTPCTLSFAGENGAFTVAAGENGIAFSEGTSTFFKGNAAKLTFYRQTETGYEKADALTEGECYVLVAKGHKGSFALAGKSFDTEHTRLCSLPVTQTGNAVTGPTALPAGEPGFTTAFMGSMRFYNNRFNGMIGAGYPDIVQALLVYVYTDRVELQMKNYGKENGGEQILASYTVDRVFFDAEEESAA